jgi:hypothetical protein
MRLCAVDQIKSAGLELGIALTVPIEHWARNARSVRNGTEQAMVASPHTVSARRELATNIVMD